MVSVPQVISFYEEFFKNVLFDCVKYDDKIMSEWEYFTSLLSQSSPDKARIRTYLDIIRLNKRDSNIDTNLDNPPKEIDEPNIDTDYDGSEGSSSDSNEYEEEEDDEEN